MKYVIGNTDDYLETEDNFDLGNINSNPACVDNSVNYANNKSYNNKSHIAKLELSYMKFNNLPLAR